MRYTILTISSKESIPQFLPVVLHKYFSLILGRWAAVDVMIFLCMIEKEEFVDFVILDIGIIGM